MDIDGDIARRLVHGIQRGRYALLLGAGFSKIARSSFLNEELPLADDLAKELARKFQKSEGHPLQRLWQALPSPEREDYLCNRLKNCQVESESLPINKFIWRVIYNYNVDDVVQQIYSDGDSKQEIKTINYKKPFWKPESLGVLPCIHLHGSVLFPEDGFVFSTSEYARVTHSYSAWGPVLADELATEPFIVIGCTLDEFDLEHHLERRGPIDVANDSSPSLFVTKHLDDVLEATARRFGLLPIEASASEFLLWLKESVDPILTVDDLLRPKNASDIYVKEPPDRDKRIFHRQFVYISDNELPEPITQENFLRGIEPSWKDIMEDHDVVRSDLTRLYDKIISILEDTSIDHALLLLTSPPGCGKSTAIMRLAYICSKNNIPTFYFTGNERLSSIATANCLSKMKKHALVFVDAISEHATQVSQIAENFVPGGTKLIVVGADRDANYKEISLRIENIKIFTNRLNALSKLESSDLVKKLRREGLLGRKAHLSDNQLRDRIIGKELIVALCEVTGDKNRFNDILKSIWDAQGSIEVQRLLTVIALTYAHGYPVKFSIAQSISGLTVHEIRKIISTGSLQDVIFRTKLYGEYLQLAHRVLAERLVANIIPRDVLFDSYVELAIKIAPYVSRDTLKRLTTEVRICRRLLDYEPYVKLALKSRAKEFYNSIRDSWMWNSRYWEQMALLELDSKNYKIAITHAEQAVSIERHPLTCTTLGKVLMKTSVAPEFLANNEEIFSMAIDALKTAIELRRLAKYTNEHAHHVSIVGAIEYFEKFQKRPWRDASEWIDNLLLEAKEKFKFSDINWKSLEQRWDKVKK